jgi:hypothetical protein
MKFLYIKRKTKTESRYSPKMGVLTTKVTYIKKYLTGIPINTVHKYRETYYGSIKSCEDCNLAI